MSIGSRIDDLIEDHDITRAEFAKIMHITPVTLSRYTHDVIDPRASLLHKIAEYFGVSMDYFWR